jgi:hypothetical protein
VKAPTALTVISETATAKSDLRIILFSCPYCLPPDWLRQDWFSSLASGLPESELE